MSFWSKLRGGPPGPPPDRTVEILDRHLSRDFRISPMAAKPLTAKDVEAVGRRLGIPLPPEVVAHLTGTFPGMFVEAKEAVWPRPKEYDVGPFWSFLYAVYTYTAATGSKDWMRIEVAAAELREATGLVAAPVLKVMGDADVYCVCPDGSLARLDHEAGRLEKVEKGFFEILDLELGELRARTERRKTLRSGGGAA